MKKAVLCTVMLLLASYAQAQNTVPPAQVEPQSGAPAQVQQQQAAPTPQAYKGLAQQWGVIVFPAKGQTKDQQEKDEYDCYKWAKDATGIDPLGPPPPPKQPDSGKPPPGTGAVVGGAAVGAAGGAAIGGIAGDAGEGAAIGATMGAMRGVKKKITAKKQAEAKAEAEQKSEAQQRQATFNKGFGACLEGKNYTVK